MKNAKIAMAAALVAAGVGLSVSNAATPTTAPSAVKTSTVANTAVKSPAAPSPAQIGGMLAGVTTDALTPKDMTRLVTFFDPARRQSVAKSDSYSLGYGNKLDARITSIEKTWKLKYGRDFSLSSAQSAINPAQSAIQMQSAGNSARTASAMVTLKNTGNASALQVPMTTDKSGAWKIQVPATLTAERLRANLLAELGAFADQSAKWPANESDAYRAVEQHVLMAVLDKPMPAAAHAQAPATSPPAAKAATTPPAQTPIAKSTPAAPSHHWWQFWNW